MQRNSIDGSGLSFNRMTLWQKTVLLVGTLGGLFSLAETRRTEADTDANSPHNSAQDLHHQLYNVFIDVDPTFNAGDRQWAKALYGQQPSRTAEQTEAEDRRAPTVDVDPSSTHGKFLLDTILNPNAQYIPDYSSPGAPGMSAYLDVKRKDGSTYSLSVRNIILGDIVKELSERYLKAGQTPPSAISEKELHDTVTRQRNALPKDSNSAVIKQKLEAYSTIVKRLSNEPQKSR